MKAEKPTAPCRVLKRAAQLALLCGLSLGVVSCGALNSVTNGVTNVVRDVAKLPSQLVNSVL
ncbi:MAG: hypothetical protein Q3986_00065 [Akkermansia sp.]|nr:hypothetical protein [Akkermansia sp.]